MYDEFGLDKHDIHTADFHNSFGKWFFGKISFIAWWVLQHIKGYKPLNTKIYNNETISGTVNMGNDN